MSAPPLDPRLVHPLPAAPHFVGRAAELEELGQLWQSGFRGVVALVGLGGAGKTAMAARFLEKLAGSTPRPHGLFVWSFYQEPDAGRFLQEAYAYFAPARTPEMPARGAGLLHLLGDALTAGGPHLLVLDGLERVQRQADDAAGGYGQLEDPLLKALLTRSAAGTGQAFVLVTSRFPLTDMKPFQGHGYRHLDVNGLDPDAAQALLVGRGVRGDTAALHRLIDAYGAHALTLDHLGGFIGQFLAGDPNRAPEVPSLGAGADRQGLRLARLLRAYEEHLPEAELALLCRLCLLRRGVTEEQLLPLFLCTPAVHARTIREISAQVAHLPNPGKWPEAQLADVAVSVQAAIEEAHCAAPIAGPEELFRQEVIRGVAAALDFQDLILEDAAGAVVRFYAGKGLDAPSDWLPLPEQDRAALRSAYDNYLDLRDHPLLPFKAASPVLEQAFQNIGYEKTAQVTGEVRRLRPHPC